MEDNLQIKSKKLPYWLKGGIITSVIFIIIPIIIILGVFLIDAIFPVPEEFGWYGFIGLWFITFPGYLFFGFDGLFRIDGFREIITTFILSLIIYFIIGSIIGWIYGKIKNRK